MRCVSLTGFASNMENKHRKVVITGITGVLGQALGKRFHQEGAFVIGVSRSNQFEAPWLSQLLTLDQNSLADVGPILDVDPDVIILNAGQIEKEIGDHGEPLPQHADSINRINYQWPCDVAMGAMNRSWTHPLDVIAIGSIADCCPSSFGPVYHSSKIALHYFWTGAGPIFHAGSQQQIRLRLYRPGAIKSDLAWAPVNRLIEGGKGHQMRKKRVAAPPSGEQVADHFHKWFLKPNAWVGGWGEPISFKALRLIFGCFPNLFYKMQCWAWKKQSRFSQ